MANPVAAQPALTAEGTTEGPADPVRLLEVVRRQPERLKGWSLLPWVEEWSRHWRALPDPLAAADQLLAAAWLVRKKADVLLAAKEREEVEGQPGTADAAAERGAPAAWMARAVQALQGRWLVAARMWPRAARAPLPPAPVADATPARLAAAWPRTRWRPPPEPRVVEPARDRLAWVAVRWWRRLRRAPDRRLRFQEAVESWQPAVVVPAFLAVLWLWQRARLELWQPMPFGPLEIWLPGRRPERGGARPGP